MRYSRALLPILKEAPADASSTSHVFLLRAGYVRRVGAVDDREERPGVTFKDADLIGIRLRAVVGARGLKNGQIEFKLRTEPDPKKVELLAQNNAAESIAQRVRELLAQTGTKAN